MGNDGCFFGAHHALRDGDPHAERGEYMILYLKGLMPQLGPQQCFMAQESAAGQAGVFAALWAAGTLKFRSKSVFPHSGHCGVSSARVNHSNSRPHPRQEYS
jgi:hypothetical protein